MRIGGIVCLALLAVLAGGRARADAEPTPYAVLYEVLAPARHAAAFDRLVASARIESKSDGVSPADIRLEIGARAGAIAIVPRADGSVDFPFDDALLAENPPVLTNQPKGTLTLSVTLALRAPERTPWPVAEIQAALVQVEKLLHEHPAPGAGPRVRGAEFRFEPGSDARLTVHGRSERLLGADAAGRIVLMREPDLGAGATEVELSRRPLSVVPYLGE